MFLRLALRILLSVSIVAFHSPFRRVSTADFSKPLTFASTRALRLPAQRRLVLPYHRAELLHLVVQVYGQYTETISFFAYLESHFALSFSNKLHGKPCEGKADNSGAEIIENARVFHDLIILQQTAQRFNLRMGEHSPQFFCDFAALLIRIEC